MTGVGKQQAILCLIVGICCAACCLAVAHLIQNTGKNGFDALPFIYYTVLMICPLLSLAALAGLWQLRPGTVCPLMLGGILTVPQVLVFGLFLAGIFQYA